MGPESYDDLETSALKMLDRRKDDAVDDNVVNEPHLSAEEAHKIAAKRHLV